MPQIKEQSRLNRISIDKGANGSTVSLIGDKSVASRW
jgi:hypothetical protein